MDRLLVFMISLAFHSAVLASWKVDESVDPMTDEVRKTAIVENDLGHTFSVYRISEGGPVWGNFALSDGMFDQVDWEKPPIYRVDKNEPTNLARMKKLQEMGLGIHAYEWEPKWVNFLIWHGKENEGMANGLVQIMEGEKVVFRYYLSTGGYKDTTFPLKGASSAISDAIGISSEIDSAVQKRNEEFTQAFLTESKRCQEDMSSFKSCFAEINECKGQANRDVNRFKACFR